VSDFPLLDLIERKKAAWAGAEAGAELAADHAERVEPGWKDAALTLLCRFAAGSHGAPFMIEDVRDYADEMGLSPPPTARAWGAVTLRAKREGFIVRAGFSHTTRGPAHAHPSTLWRLAHG
jgi:hypothetical protein